MHRGAEGKRRRESWKSTRRRLKICHLASRQVFATYLRLRLHPSFSSGSSSTEDEPRELLFLLSRRHIFRRRAPCILIIVCCYFRNPTIFIDSFDLQKLGKSVHRKFLEIVRLWLLFHDVCVAINDRLRRRTFSHITLTFDTDINC